MFFNYFLYPFFIRYYKEYIEILIPFYDLIYKIFYCFRKCRKFYGILEIVGIIFGCIFIPIYVIAVPISIHYMIKNLYYGKFLQEINDKYNNKLCILIIIGEEILSLIFIFSLFALHYFYTIIFFPIFLLVVFIRNIIYKLPLCYI